MNERTNGRVNMFIGEQRDFLCDTQIRMTFCVFPSHALVRTYVIPIAMLRALTHQRIDIAPSLVRHIVSRRQRAKRVYMTEMASFFLPCFIGGMV